MRRTLIALTVAALATGCWGGYAQARAEHRAAVRKRAAFDLSCSEDRLTVVPLQTDVETPRQYGVEGCGDRAVYVNVSEIEWETPGTWILNSNNPASED